MLVKVLGYNQYIETANISVVSYRSEGFHLRMDNGDGYNFPEVTPADFIADIARQTKEAVTPDVVQSMKAQCDAWMKQLTSTEGELSKLQTLSKEMVQVRDDEIERLRDRVTLLEAELRGRNAASF